MDYKEDKKEKEKDKEKENENDYEKIKKLMDKGKNLVDYFITIGISNDTIFNNELYTKEIEELNNSNLLQPTLINKFPPFKKSFINVDESIIGHLFPDGYKMIHSDFKPKNDNFFVILDNSFYGIDYLQSYISCLLFYESVEDYFKCYVKYIFIQNYEHERNSINNNLRKSEKIKDDTLLNLDKFDLENSITNKSKTPKNFERLSFSLNDTSHLQGDSLKSQYLKFGGKKRNISYGEDFLNKSQLNSTFIKTFNNEYDIKKDLLEDSILSSLFCRAKIFKNYYCPKIIAFISVYSNINYMTSILNLIYQYHFQAIQPIEKLIFNFVMEAPAPPKGLHDIEYNFLNMTFNFNQNEINKLPTMNASFIYMFVFLNTSSIIEIFGYLIQEIKIIFFSENIKLLSPIIEGLIKFIYPFSYMFYVVSILKNDCLSMLNTTTPYVFGVNKKYNYLLFDEIDFDDDDNICVVDIDRGEVYKFTVKSGKMKINTNNSDFPLLPQYYYDKLSSRLNNESYNLFSKLMKSSKINKNGEKLRKYFKEAALIEKIESLLDIKSKNINLITNELEQIQYYFLQCVVKIMQNFDEYIKNNIHSNNSLMQLNLKSIFEKEKFINSKPKDYKQFYEKFLDTQLFTDFIINKIIPMNIKEKLKVVFLEEHLIKKNNRSFFSKKKETPFLDTKEFEKKSSFKVNKNFSLSITEKFNLIKKSTDKNFELSLIKNGSQIEINSDINVKEFEDTTNSKSIRELEILKNSISDKSNFSNENSQNNLDLSKIKLLEKLKDSDFNFKYFYFPCLNLDYFNSNLNDFYVPINFSETVDNLCIEILSKMNINQGISFINEMKNDIFISWMQLWAISLWYQNENEKIYLFNLLLTVLSKTLYQDIETFTILMQAISKYGGEKKDLMVLKLFEILVKYRINPNNSIRNLVLNSCEKLIKNNNKVKDKLLIIEYVRENEKYLVNNDDKKLEFSPREIKLNTNLVFEKNQIFFEIEDICVECGNVIDVFACSKNYQNISKNLVWAECSKCKNLLLPKLKMIMGVNIIKNTKNSINNNKCNQNNNNQITTDYSEKFILYSPYYLKYNIRTCIINEFALNLNLTDFNNRFSVLFWNCIWYFSIEDLNFDFLLSYKKYNFANIAKKFIENNNFNETSEILISESINNKSDYIITVENKEITDQVLIKSDKYIPYNSKYNSKVSNSSESAFTNTSIEKVLDNMKSNIIDMISNSNNSKKNVSSFEIHFQKLSKSCKSKSLSDLDLKRYIHSNNSKYDINDNRNDFLRCHSKT